jgi:anti-sigma factor RsiW
MEHLEAWNLLDEYHDGELAGAAASLVRDHLKSCPECANALAGRETLARTVRNAALVRPSEGFVLAVSRLAAESRAEQGAFLRWPVPAMAVALAASALIMVGLFSPAPKANTAPGLISTTFEYEKGGPMPVLEEAVEIADHDQVLGSLLEES